MYHLVSVHTFFMLYIKQCFKIVYAEKKKSIHNTALIKLLRAATVHPLPSLLFKNSDFKVANLRSLQDINS